MNESNEIIPNSDSNISFQLDLPTTSSGFTASHYHELSDSDEGELTNFESIPQKNEIASNSDTQIQSQMSTIKGGKPKKIRKISDEKKKIKETQLLEKLKKKQISNQLKRKQPGECLKYLIVKVDRILSLKNIFMKALEVFPECSIKFLVVDQIEPNCITWKKSEPEEPDENQDVVLFVWSIDQIIEHVRHYTLVSVCDNLCSLFTNHRILLGIYGLNYYFWKTKKNSNFRTDNFIEGEPEPDFLSKKRKPEEFISPDQIEMALTRIQIVYNICYRSLDTPLDLSELIFQLSKSLAETPYRKNKESTEMEWGFYTRGYSKDCVRIDKNFNGLFQLWLQQLCQFNLVTLDIARSIAQVYPTPLCLFTAYEKCATVKEKESLLQNIVVQRNNASTSTCRKIGPELSKKICLFLTETNGNILLSQE